MALAKDSALTPEAAECFAWFRTLGHPEIKHATWAEIWWGRSRRLGQDPEAADTRSGFIIEAKGRTFTVLADNLTTYTLSMTKPGTDPLKRVGYEERSFRKDAAKVLNQLRHPPVLDQHNAAAVERDFWDHMNVRLAPKAKVFFLAFACHEKGEDDLAQALFDEAKKIPVPNGNKVEASLMLDLEQEFALEAMWHGILLFGGGALGWDERCNQGPLIPRRELLAYFRGLVKHYPHSPQLEPATQIVEKLERMVQEDKEHEKISDEALAKLPVKERVDELIYRLRDQNGHQRIAPGECEIFEDLGKGSSGHSAAHRLADIGYAAVPQLIDALDDKTFTRSVGLWRDFTFSHTVLTVGDCAVQVLSRIAHQNFPTTDSPITRKRIFTWWHSIQSKGETATLAETIASGAIIPRPLVERLKALDPGAVEAAVMAGAEKAKDDWMRENFLPLVGEIQSPEATDYLLQHLKNANTFNMRLNAAELLLKRGHPAGLSAIVTQWGAVREHPNQMRGDGMKVMSVLLRSGKAEAFRALVDKAEQLDVSSRSLLVWQFNFSAANLRHEATAGKAGIIGWEAEAREAAEQFLIHELEDTALSWGFSSDSDDPSEKDIRICDVALRALHQIAPSRFAFSEKAGRQQWDKERVTAANRWCPDRQTPPLLFEDLHRAKLKDSDALRVTHIRISPRDLPSLQGLTQQIIALHGQHVSTENLLSVVRAYAQNPPTGTGGLFLTAMRDHDLTGVTLEVNFVKMAESLPKNGSEWSMNSGVISDGKYICNFGWSPAKSADVKGDVIWKNFAETTPKALLSAPTTSFTLSLSLEPH